MRFFSNCLLTGGNGTKYPAGEQFEVKSAGVHSPGLQGAISRTSLTLTHRKSNDIIEVYDYHGVIVDKDVYVRYPALLGLATAMGYLVDIKKLNAASLEDQEVHLLKYRTVTPVPLKVLDVTIDALDAYDRRDELTYRLLTSYQAAVEKFRSIFANLTIRGDQHAS